MKTLKKSFYALEIFLEPGGARKSEVYAFENLDLIKTALRRTLSTADDMYHLLLYGESINLLVYQAGDETQRVNLLPLIRVKIEGYPEAWFDESGAMQGFAFRDFLDDEEDDVEGEIPRFDEDEFSEKVYDDSLKFSAAVDWERIPVAPLEGEPIQKGDKVAILSGYFGDERTVGYGLTELEAGEADENIADEWKGQKPI